MRTRSIQNNFRAGVLSPNTMGLVGTDVYNSGLQVGNNVVVETMGGIKRRAGTSFVTNYGDVKYMRIFPFTFNRDQTYVVSIILDATDTARMDIYRDGVLVAPNIIVPYGTEDKIKELDFAQSADSMIFTQGDTPVYYLRRLGDDTSWDFIPVPFTNPPQHGLVDAWSDTLGYPKYCTFHQGRLWFAGSHTFPQNIWASKSQDFFNFDLGTQSADSSIQEALDTKFINPIVSIFSARQLQVFTRGSEFANQATVITPDTSNWVPQSDYGSAYYVPPVTVDGATLFVDSSGRTIRNFVYSDERNGYDAPSISSMAEHLINEPQRMGVLRGGANEPANFVYVVNIDGTIAVLNISKAHDLLAWTQWTTQGFYREVITIDRDVYILTQRYLNSDGGEFVTYEGDIVTHNDEAVYIGGNPNDNVSLEWVLERMDSEMLVDSGVRKTNIVDLLEPNVNKSQFSFFGIYYDPNGIKGKVVIVKDGIVRFQSEFLRNHPKDPYVDDGGTRYSVGDIFSYNEDVREKYFDIEVGYRWYMHILFSITTVDSGKNYIDTLGHLIGLECVTSLDGNIQDPQVVTGGGLTATVEKSYPDGNVWLYDVNNIVVETLGDSISIDTVCFYGGVEYQNVQLTDYGYLISGVVGEIGSVYLESGVVNEAPTVTGEPIFTASGSYTPPNGISSLDICMIGGGGAGIGGGFGGGFSGDIVSTSLAVSRNVSLAVVIGLGGVGNIATPSTASSIGALVADGGGLGLAYQGNGASRTTCRGTAVDGLIGCSVNSSYGGQAGFGNGGKGGCDGTNSDGEDGGVGAGGGGALNTTVGNGGRGEVVVNTGFSTIQTKKSQIRKVMLIESVTSDGVLTYENTPFNVGQAGLYFPVIAQTMPLNVSSGAGSQVNEPKRIVSVISRYKDTQGVIVNGIELPERVFGQEVLDHAPPLLTGVEKNRHLGYNRDTSVTITQNDPMPFTLLSIDVEINF